MEEQNKVAMRRALFIGGLCLLILMGGMGVMRIFVGMKKPPQQAEMRERAVRVQILRAKFENVQVPITGYGQVRVRDEYNIAPGIAGKIVAIHPRLEVGEIVRAGEVLFKIDPIDYRARLEETRATVSQFESGVKRLEKQHRIDQERLKTFERSRELAKAEFERIHDLFAQDNIESQSVLDSKEMAFNNAEDAYALLAQSVELYPIRIQETRSNLAAANASLTKAEADLGRTVVVSEGDVRVKAVSLEMYQFVSPSDVILTLADDSHLEIPVSINSREARRWLRFDETKSGDNKAWFNELTQAPVEIAWTEALEEHRWTGTLNRVERFDEQTRTLTLIISIAGANAVMPDRGHLPLVEGMFCRARIPGKTASDVVKLPAEAVGFDREASGYRSVFVARSDQETGEFRLETRAVKESHVEGDFVYVSQGLNEGENVITTRLVNPLENILLEIDESMVVATD